MCIKIQKVFTSSWVSVRFEETGTNQNLSWNDEIEYIVEQNNHLYTIWLSTKRESDKKVYLLKNRAVDKKVYNSQARGMGKNSRKQSCS